MKDYPYCHLLKPASHRPSNYQSFTRSGKRAAPQTCAAAQTSCIHRTNHVSALAAQIPAPAAVSAVEIGYATQNPMIPPVLNRGVWSRMMTSSTRLAMLLLMRPRSS